MKRPIELVRGLLDGATATEHRVRGRFEGHDVEVRFVDRGVGSTRVPYTEVWLLDAAVRRDLRLHVIPQIQADVDEIAHGRGTDVILGERAFDEAFFVEAAPTDVVLRLFDPATRERMIALRPLGVHTHDDGLLLEKSGWQDEPTLRGLVELGAHLVDAIPRAFEDADRAAQSRTGYRTTVTVENLTHRRIREADTVGEKRRARERRRREIGCLLAGAITLAITIFAILGVAFCGDGTVSTIEGYP